MIHMETGLYIVSLIISALTGWFTAVVMMAPKISEKNKKYLEETEDEN